MQQQQTQTLSIESTSVDKVTSFESFKLEENLLRGVYSYGFEKPSAIQQLAVKPLVDGKNLIAQAQSGSGKTGAFSIGALSRVDMSDPSTQVLILEPVRELANQTQVVIMAIGDYMNVTCCTLVGGTPVQQDIAKLKTGAQIVVGTPGRIYDMIQQGYLKTSKMKLFVMDEADELLSRNFKEQIYDIFSLLPESIQIGLFSASVPEECLEITKKFVKDPVKILVSKRDLVLEGLSQYKIDLDKEEHKIEVLLDIYTNSISQAFIFCNTQAKAEYVAKVLKEEGFPVAFSHGKMSPQERSETLDSFRKGQTRIFVSTDLLARGIDIQQISLVVNFDVPRDFDNYLHRVGRAARFGRKGIAINFVVPKDKYLVADLEKYYNMTIPEMPANVEFF